MITKAVFPVAGFGTRFLPVTKANPKEMLPIVDKPLIQYAVEEAVEAGITQLIFVTSSSKRAIEDHFDANYELEAKLEQSGQFELLEEVRKILPVGVSCAYVRQSQQLGLGHAVLCAKDIVGSDPFAVLLADDLIVGDDQSCLQQMLHMFNETGSSVLATQEVPLNEAKKYGIVEPDYAKKAVLSIVEKPEVADAPSNMAVVGRYILTPAIFPLLQSLRRGRGGEIQLTDGIAQLLEQEQVQYCLFNGKRYDCGSKIGYMQANIDFALLHPDLGPLLKEYLRERI